MFVCADAPLHKGMSGGPLLDGCGRLVGMGTFVDFELRGLGFSLASNRILDRADTSSRFTTSSTLSSKRLSSSP